MDIKPFNSDVGTALVNRISDAIGVRYEPHRIIRKAEAEAKALKIHTKAEIESSELQQRAMQRWVHEETRKQANIESIQEKAIPLLEDDAKPQDMEEDWIAHFFEKCRNTSDEEMQSLWARILAGEANYSGSFSKRALNIISTLEKEEAEAFTSVCSFSLTDIDQEIFIPIILNQKKAPYNEGKITHRVLENLESIGLIKFDPSSEYHNPKSPPKIKFRYFNKLLSFSVKKSPMGLSIGNVSLTSSGLQLAKICGAKPNDKFIDYIVSEYGKRGIGVKVHKLAIHTFKM